MPPVSAAAPIPGTAQLRTSGPPPRGPPPLGQRAAAAVASDTSTAVGSLCHLSRELLTAVSPRLARHPLAQSYGDFASAHLDIMPQDLMLRTIERLNAVFHE